MPLFSRILLMAAAVSFVCCSLKRSIDVSKQSLIGCWQNAETNVLHYSRLVITDSVMVLTSRADTVFRYRFQLRGQSILMIDVLGDTSMAAVKAIDSSQLQFAQLLGKTNVTYRKCVQ